MSLIHLHRTTPGGYQDPRHYQLGAPSLFEPAPNRWRSVTLSDCDVHRSLARRRRFISSSTTMAGPSRAPDTSAPQWRQFTFFDLDNVKDADDLASAPRAIKELSPPIVATPTSSQSPLPPSLIVSSGNVITVFDRHFVPERSFLAWEGNGRATALVEAGGLLLAVGEDEGSRQPVLKVWDLTRDEKRRRGDPLLMRNVKIQQAAGRPHPVSKQSGTS